MTDTPATERLSIAQMQSSDDVTLPQRSYSLCLSGKAMASIRSLMVELQNVLTEDQARHDATRPAEAPEAVPAAGGPARLGQPAPEPLDEAPESARAREVRAKIAEARAVMDRHTGELTVQADDPGGWRAWCDAHPARDKNARDTKFGHGVCDTDALDARLKDFAHSWNGDELKPGQWEFIRSKVSLGDLNQVLSLVVSMNEGSVDLGKLRTASLAALSSESD